MEINTDRRPTHTHIRTVANAVIFFSLLKLIISLVAVYRKPYYVSSHGIQQAIVYEISG